MTAELVDEPELVQHVARLAARLPQPLARQLIDLCGACFDAGYANGMVAKVVTAPTVAQAMRRVRLIIPPPPDPDDWGFR